MFEFLLRYIEPPAPIWVPFLFLMRDWVGLGLAHANSCEAFLPLLHC